MPTETNSAAVADAVAPAAGAVAREFHRFLADIEDLLTSTTSLTGEDLARARDRIGARIATARDAVGRMGDALGGQARRGVTATDDYVHQQPWQAIGIGTAVGVLFGILLARRG